MRDSFMRALAQAAEADPSVILLTGDLGFGVLNDYRERFPDQFMNLGVAEQNLASVAAGLALTGHRVFTYSIANFPTLRCLEQLRNDVCYHQAAVTVVAVGGGMAYGALGPSHFATEDLAILRALPGMAVVAPGDPVEVEALVPQILQRGGPAYLRLGRAGEPAVHGDRVEIRLGRPVRVREGDQACLLSTGGMLSVTMSTASILSEVHGVECDVVSVHTLSPLDEDALLELVAGHDVVFCCEEHSIVGGLGGLVSEQLAGLSAHPRVVRFGLKPAFPEGIGSQEYLRMLNGLDEEALVDRVLTEISR
jgi:transketolase